MLSLNAKQSQIKTRSALLLNYEETRGLSKSFSFQKLCLFILRGGKLEFFPIRERRMTASDGEVLVAYPPSPSFPSHLLPSRPSSPFFPLFISLISPSPCYLFSVILTFRLLLSICVTSPFPSPFFIHFFSLPSFVFYPLLITLLFCSHFVIFLLGFLF